jgi:hypothetical protein
MKINEKYMRFLLRIMLVAFIATFVGCSDENPYEEGMHFTYHIHCENGFVYKQKNGRIIQVLNSDGTPLKCGNKIY